MKGCKMRAANSFLCLNVYDTAIDCIDYASIATEALEKQRNVGQLVAY
jgi:hypothetical protein